MAVGDEGVLAAARVRAGAGPGGGRLPAADGLERRARGPRLRGAAADAEGARDRAARRLAPRRGRLPAPHRARARRDGARAPDADADRARKCEIEPEEHTSTIVFGERGGDPDPRLRRAGGRGARRRASTPRRPTRSSSGCGSSRARRAGAPRSTTDPARPRRASTSARSRSRRAATPARSRSRGCTSAATRTARCACSRSTAAAPGAEVRLGEKAVGRVTSAVPGARARLRARRGPGRRRARGGRQPRAATLTRPRP